jgi:cobalt-zinc-cadmium efflux system protein
MSGHEHEHGRGESSRIGIAFALNLTFAVIELIGGFLTNSVAILSNALHDFGDAMAIGFGWISSRQALRAPDVDYTYGYRRLSLLSALVNGIILSVGSVLVIAHALPRLWDPQPPAVGGMFALALLGLAINGFAALRLRGGHTHNEKILSWHLLEDVFGWFAVLLGSVIIHFTGWIRVDPLLSIAFALFILFNVVRNLRNTLRLFLQVSPDRALTARIRDTLETLDGVAGSHHLHLWSLDGHHHVLTTHLTLQRNLDSAQQLLLKENIHRSLEPFALAHTTIEFEFPAEICRDE